MGILFDANEPGPAVLAAEAERLHSLASDLRALAAGTAPRESELRIAPLLEGWAVSMRPTQCLVGVANGHPVLQGPVIRTSALWLLAPSFGWARTLSRFYRLGAPAVVTRDSASALH